MAELRINIEIGDLDDVQRALDRAERALTPPSFTDSLGKGADVMVEAVKHAAPKKTGRLAESTDKWREGPDRWLVGPDTVYARIQDQGGTIYPHGRFLVFEGRDGNLVFARHVTLRGQHYMDRAFEEGREPAAAAVFEDILRKIAG